MPAAGDGGPIGALAQPHHPTRPVTTRTRAQAPAAIPEEIRRERDPVKRERMLQRLRVNAALVRLATLRRRKRLLRASLERLDKSDDKPTKPDTTSKRQRIEHALGKLDHQIEQAKRDLLAARPDP